MRAKTQKPTLKERRRETIDDQDCDPLDYVVDFEEILRTVDAVIAYSRISHRNEDLDAHERFLLMCMETFGIAVFESFAGEEKGYHFTERSRPKLFAACASARRHGLPIVTLALSRPLRAESWRIDNQQAMPTRAEFEQFAEFTQGVTVATWLPPGAGYEAERALFSSIKNGRPMRPKHRRELLRPQAIEMKASGWARRAIGRELQVSNSTLQGWGI